MARKNLVANPVQMDAIRKAVQQKKQAKEDKKAAKKEAKLARKASKKARKDKKRKRNDSDADDTESSESEPARQVFCKTASLNLVDNVFVFKSSHPCRLSSVFLPSESSPN